MRKTSSDRPGTGREQRKTESERISSGGLGLERGYAERTKKAGDMYAGRAKRNARGTVKHVRSSR